MDIHCCITLFHPSNVNNMYTRTLCDVTAMSGPAFLTKNNVSINNTYLISDATDTSEPAYVTYIELLCRNANIFCNHEIMTHDNLISTARFKGEYI